MRCGKRKSIPNDRYSVTSVYIICITYESDAQDHHQNDSCIKMSRYESRLNVTLTVSGKVTKTVSINHNL